MTFDPTPEQRAAIGLFMTGKSMKIEAGAGTGKTSTLILLAEAAPERHGQYIAFNKAIVTDAAAKMPGNVIASTAHSLAYRAVVAANRQIAQRLRSSARMKSMDIARVLRIDPLMISYGSQTKPMAAGYLAGLVMRTIGNFCQSADPEPTERHTPYIDGIDVPTADGRHTFANNDLVRRHIAPYVRRAWADITDPTGQLPYKHDHYLKTWQLSKPVIMADFILFDEAQDANPVMVDIVARQADHAQLVWVGDSQQQIYSFTGAINALEKIPAENTTYLTQSFRFGQAIADVANGLLGRLQAELRLRGYHRIASVVAAVAEPDCILTRTNALAMTTVLEQIKLGRKVSLVGGGAEIISFAKAAKDLQAGRWTSHPELACFQTWGEVQEYVHQDEQGGDLRLMVNLIDEFGADTILRALEHNCREDEADVIVSTAHKAKGREWGTVQIAGDFTPAKSGDDSPDEELRLLYVACTRAKRELDVTACPHALAAPKPAQAPLLALNVPAGPSVAETPAVTAPAAQPARPTACPDCGRTDVIRPSTGLIGVHVCAGIKA